MTDATFWDADRPANDRTKAAAVGWCSITAGAISGLILGLWSFGGPIPTPEWIGAYDDLPRRFLRLAHVAMFALGILLMLVSRQLSAASLGRRLDRLGLNAMIMGTISMPVILIGAAIFEPLKYLTPIPAICITTAVSIAAFSAIRQIVGASK